GWFTRCILPLMGPVEVEFVNVRPLESQLLGAVNATEPFIVSVPPLDTVTSPAVPVDVVEPMKRSWLVVVYVPVVLIWNTAPTLIALLAVIEAPVSMVRLLKPAVPFSLTVFDTPVSVTVLVPFVNFSALLSYLHQYVQAPL